MRTKFRCSNHFCRKYFIPKNLHNSNLYCSLKCFHLSRVSTVEKTCEWCGIAFKVNKARANSSFTCSNFCRTSRCGGKLEDKYNARVIRSIDTNACWSWRGTPNGNGYPTIGHKGKVLIASRVSYELHFGEFDKALWVLHKCDNPICTNPTHLYLGTRADNMRDMVDRARQPRGERARLSKLKLAQVKLIWLDDRPARIVAQDYGITRQTVRDIKNGKTWKGQFTRA
jgi:hypothetical protein